VVGSLLSTAAARLNAYLTRAAHEHALVNAAGIAGEVKCELKLLGVEPLDRYRKKVEKAIEDCECLLVLFDRNLGESLREGRTCDAYLELAIAMCHAKRRIEIFKNHSMYVLKVMQKTLGYIAEIEGRPLEWPDAPIGAVGGEGFARTYNGTARYLHDLIKKEIDYVKAETVADRRESYVDLLHGKCSRWCCFRPDVRFTPATFKDKVGLWAGKLFETLSPDSLSGGWDSK